MKRQLTAIILLSFGLLVNMPTFANFNTMMKYYNNPALAPKVKQCKGDVMCNGFVALAKQWKSIPNHYRYVSSSGYAYDVKKDAEKGDGYGLNKGGLVPIADRSQPFFEAGDKYFYDGGSKTRAQERIFAQGIVVLLYIESKNGWSYKKFD